MRIFARLFGKKKEQPIEEKISSATGIRIKDDLVQIQAKVEQLKPMIRTQAKGLVKKEANLLKGKLEKIRGQISLLKGEEKTAVSAIFKNTKNQLSTLK